MASIIKHHPSDPQSLPSYQKIAVHYPTDGLNDEHNLQGGIRRRGWPVLGVTLILSLFYIGLIYQSPNAVSMSSAKEDFVVPVSSAPKSWISKDWNVLMGKSKKDKSEKSKSKKKKDKESDKEEKKEAKDKAKEKKTETKEEEKQAKQEKKDEEKKADSASASKQYWKDYGKEWKQKGNDWKTQWGKYTEAPMPAPTAAPSYSAMPTEG